MASTLDITPSPRVLRMLGEIDFKAWQCLCEIIDNSIDSFSENNSITLDGYKPTVTVKLPPNILGISQGFIEISDNGVGMSFEALGRSLKAGFSANNPVDKMGLFGMGFNISTARLGARTEVITTTKDSDHYLKVAIDFQELEKGGHFLVPVEQIPKKPDEQFDHGTKIRISKLRDEHVRHLYQKKRISEKLGKIYGRLIRTRGICIKYQGILCKPIKHCVWDKSREGAERHGKNVPAVIDIDHLIDTKKYCSTCWVWLSEFDDVCPSCGQDKTLSMRERRVKGWVGIQRYFDDKHYGIDLIRNGRIIQELDKSFFYWDNPNDDEDPELEYPIDGHERKGRIVGELEIDFVKVTHQKDAFNTDSNDWKQVVSVVRGDAPMRPKIAISRGYVENTSYLAQLYNAFRGAKAGIKNLVPQRVSGQALITDPIIDDLKERFFSGESGYDSDQKWWELLVSGGKKFTKEETGDDGSGGNPFGEEENESASENTDETSDDSIDSEVDTDLAGKLNVEPDTELSKTYSLSIFNNVFIRVIAERVLEGNHNRGFSVEIRGSELFFKYWPAHAIYTNQLFQAADFLINELAYHLHSSAHNQVADVPISAVELALRDKYFPELHPSVNEVSRQIELLVEDFTTHLKKLTSKITPIVSSDFSDASMGKIRHQLAENELLNAKQITDAIENGDFLSYAPVDVIILMIRKYPNLFFDGVFFKPIWEGEDNSLTDFALDRELNLLLSEIEWFLGSSPSPNKPMWRGRMKRLIGCLEIAQAWRV